MEHLHPAPFLKDERQKTDDSLIAERDKTNESFSKSKSGTEIHTDQKVQGERELADRTISESRDQADLDSNKKPVESELDQLVSERIRADKAIELERAQVDLAFDREREAKNLLADQLLEQERKLTDKNLLAERKRTDTEVHRTTGLLSDEIYEHSKTKVSLTTRDEFLAIVSHDLRNPIGAASMGTALLLEDPAFSTIGTEARKTVELIKRNIDISLRLIADLLDMERIEGGKLQLLLKKYDILKLIQEVVDCSTPAALAKGIDLQIAASAQTGEVVCDKDRLMQVLSNLISNVLKFTPKGGSVTVSAVLNAEAAQFSVCDTGPGIPEERRLKIFERYAQLQVSDRDGLGLGLYISKMLVEAHQGRLWVTSNPGSGSTFNITVPRNLGRKE